MTIAGKDIKVQRYGEGWIQESEDDVYIDPAVIEAVMSILEGATDPQTTKTVSSIMPRLLPAIHYITSTSRDVSDGDLQNLVDFIKKIAPNKTGVKVSGGRPDSAEI